MLSSSASRVAVFRRRCRLRRGAGTHDQKPEHERHLRQQNGLNEVPDLVFVCWKQEAGKADGQIAETRND
jgi:hypothetical protein